MNVAAIREKLISEHKSLGSWRLVANQYSDADLTVNVAYVYNLALHGKVPGSRAVRIRLGLERGPKPKAQRSALESAWVRMAVATRRAVEGWRR